MEKDFLKQAWDDWDAERVAVNDKALIQQTWGDWLGDWDWEWYCTLTFRDNVGVRRANSLWQMWYKRHITATRKDVQYVRFTEWQRNRGVPHYHVLMLNLKHVRRLTWLDRWVDLAGWARIHKYNSNKGAAYYLSKYITKETGEVKFSEGLQDFVRSANRPEQLEFS